MIHFELKTGPDQGRRFSLNDERVVIGRGPHCQIRLSSGLVSLRHCEVRRDQQGSGCVVRDLGSSNGTRVGGPDEPPLEHPRRLRSGDTIWIGDVRIEITIDEVGTRRRHRTDYAVIDRPTEDDLFAHQAAHRPRLRFLAGPHRDRLVLLGDRPLLLGRGEESEVVLHDPLLELRHVIISRNEGQYSLLTLEGVEPRARVNAVAIESRARLHHGDVISLGSSVLEYLDSAVSEYADPFETVAFRQPRFVLFGEVHLAQRVRIGCDPTADLFLDDPAVARRHAEIYFVGRAFMIRSIGGAEVTVDGRAAVEAPLRNGDLVRVGAFELRIDLEGFNCVIDVARASRDEQMPRFANDIDSVSPYQTVYRRAAPTAPEKDRRGGPPRWRPLWDVKKSRRLPIVIGASLAGVVLLGGFTIQGGGRRLLEQPISSAHASIDGTKDRCGACHGGFARPDQARCAVCHPSQTPRPLHDFSECTRCHVEHRADDRLALVSSARCAACHPDRHVRFAPVTETPGSRSANATGTAIPALLADLDFDPVRRSRALHRRHGAVARGCAACHERTDKEALEEPYRSCFACHPGKAALASAPCARCHREHGDEWAKAPVLAKEDAPVRPLAQAGLGVVALMFLAISGMVGHAAAERRRVRASEAAAKEKEESAPPGGKYEVRINYGKCVPIGACVKACPFDVLEMVPLPEHGGKLLPKAVRIDACKACRACEESCGVKALSVVPAGEATVAQNLPDLDPNYESNVPGLYVIGEAAGKPLVKNANNLGLHVVNHMTAGALKPGDASRAGYRYELLVLGSGPGGLSAAVSAKRRGLAVLVLERDASYATTHRRDYAKGKQVHAEPVDVDNLGHLPVRTAPKEELLEAWGELIRADEIEIRYHARVEAIERDDTGFLVVTDSAEYRSLKVVVATGSRGSPRRLDVPGADLSHVRFALQDAEDLADAACVVVGGGDSAMEVALMLSEAQQGRKGKVRLLYRGAALKRGRPETREKLDRYQAEGKLEVLLETNPVEITEVAMVIERKGGAREKLAAEAVFCMLGAEPALEFLGRIGVRILQKSADWDPGPTDVLVRRLIAEMDDQSGRTD